MFVRFSLFSLGEMADIYLLMNKSSTSFLFIKLTEKIERQSYCESSATRLKNALQKSCPFITRKGFFATLFSIFISETDIQKEQREYTENVLTSHIPFERIHEADQAHDESG